MADRTFIHVPRRQVAKAAFDRLAAQRGEGQHLESVKSLGLYGRMVGTPGMPLVSVTYGIANAVEQTTFYVKWQFPLRFTAQIDNNDPVEGFEEAEELSSLALAALFTDPETGMLDMMPGGFHVFHAGTAEPPMPSETQQNVYLARTSANVTVETTF